MGKEDQTTKKGKGVKSASKPAKKTTPRKQALSRKPKVDKAKGSIAVKKSKAPTAKISKPKKINCQLPGAELLEQGKSVGEVMATLGKKNKGGRPRKFDTAEDMQAAIEDYFESCWQEIEIVKGEGENRTVTTVKKQIRPYTVMGLALALDMTRETLCQYAKDGQFSDIVKRAKAQVEMFFEENLASGNSTGSIFWLKNHAGYKDKQEIEQTGTIVHRVELVALQ